jgi:5-methylcytosine-specific restriction endonuclease McrA
MGIDTSGFAFPKGKLRVEVKREKRLTGEEQERQCRERVWQLYGRKCGVTGCKEKATEQHHIIHRSQSKRLKYEPTNRTPLCKAHHDLEHGGKRTIHPRTADGELIVTGERRYLAFKGNYILDSLDYLR